MGVKKKKKKGKKTNGQTWVEKKKEWEFTK